MKAFLASISEGEPIYQNDPDKLVRGRTKIDAVWLHEVGGDYDWSMGPYAEENAGEIQFGIGSNQCVVVEGHPLWEQCLAHYEKEGEG